MMVDEMHHELAHQMMMNNPYHCDYSRAEREAYIEPPLSMGNYIFGLDSEATPYLFATWAYPEDRHVDEYLETGRFPVGAWRGDGDSPWIVDFICFSGRQGITEGFRSLKDIFTEMGYSGCYWLRTETGRIGYHELKRYSYG